MKKRVIALTGFMGCGKSSVGRELAALTDAHFADLDSVIVKREGRRIPEIFASGGGEALSAFRLPAVSFWRGRSASTSRLRWRTYAHV